MAARKKTRRAAPEKSKAGRKKEIKRFEMEVLNADSDPIDGFMDNEIAFVVRTSGGTPLNPTDTGKIHRLLQHELRALGHKLKRKGQELDPVEETKEENPTETALKSLLDTSGDEGSDSPEDPHAKPDPLDVELTEKLVGAPSSSPDPDDSDAHNTPDSAELTPQ